jgi:hypothetical protein
MQPKFYDVLKTVLVSRTFRGILITSVGYLFPHFMPADLEGTVNIVCNSLNEILVAGGLLYATIGKFASTKREKTAGIK